MPIIEEVTEDEPAGGGSTSNERPADEGSAGGTGTSTSGSTGQPRGWQAVSEHISTHKIDTGLWLSRLFTVMCCIVFIIPIFGQAYSYGAYQRALICNGLTSALRLHQRLPRFQMNREFFGRMLLEDSCHYLFYSLIFANSYPITLVLTPIMLYAILHASSYTRILLNLSSETAFAFIRRIIDKLATSQQQLFRFIALNEIIIFPCIVAMLFTGKSSILLPFVYYRFISLRFSSRRNPYCRVIFHEMRVYAENFSRGPSCPGFLRNIIYKSIVLLEKLAPIPPPVPQS
ncbi:transmembrane protein 33-like [Glandiceps talaboti]